MSSIIETSPCPFCKCSSQFWGNPGDIQLYGYDCETCGRYFISPGLDYKLTETFVNNELLNCISENIKNNSRSGVITTSWHFISEQNLPTLSSDITVKRYEDFASLPIIHANKPTDLLRLLASKVSIKKPFDRIEMTIRDLYLVKILDIEELLIWGKELEQRKYIDRLIIPMTSGLPALSYSITPKGWEQVYSNQQSINSKQVFIAMQFDWGQTLTEQKLAYIEAIKQGCNDCGYEAELVSDKHHIDQITDRIISKIKSARFVVTDFTFNNRGAYYEAGLARGLGIPVIHTVMSGHIHDPSDKEKQLHFDIRQINYLEWSNPVELRARLRDRIKAVIED